MAVIGPSGMSLDDHIPHHFPLLGFQLTTSATLDRYQEDLDLKHSLLCPSKYGSGPKILKLEPQDSGLSSKNSVLNIESPLLQAMRSPLIVDRSSPETQMSLQNAFNTAVGSDRNPRKSGDVNNNHGNGQHCKLKLNEKKTSTGNRRTRVSRTTDFPLLTIPSLRLSPDGISNVSKEPVSPLGIKSSSGQGCSEMRSSRRCTFPASPGPSTGLLLGVLPGSSRRRRRTKLNSNTQVDKNSEELGEPTNCEMKGKRDLRLLSRPGELEGLAMKGWPLHFHNIHSDNIQLSLDRRRAKRFESFCKGICFSNRPIALNERVYLKFSEVSTSWSGVVRFGYMSHDPATINGSELPRYACPDLTNKPGYWAKAVPERFAEQSNTLFFYFNRNGDVMFGLNNEDKGLFFSGVNTSGPLWALVDIYGNSTSMEFIDGRQMNNLSPSSGVPPADLSLSPELMQAYASMRLQQPSPGLSPGGHSQSMPSLPAAPGFSTTGPPVRFYNTVSFNPMPFHAKTGRNVCCSSDKMLAVRLVEEYCNGYVFTQRPLRPGERMVIQILSVDTAFVGGLAFGMTACDPKHLNTEELPDDSDLLLDRPEYWVVNKDVCSSPEVGDELSFHLTEDGEVRYGKNGHHIATLMHVDKTLPLWVFFDVYGSTQKIKSLGIVSGLLPVSGQHRASISSGGGLTVALPPPRQSGSPSSSSTSTTTSSSHVPSSGSSTITPPPRPPPPRNSPSTRQPPPPRSESPTPPSLPPKPFRPLPAPPPAPGTILQPTQALSAVPPASQLSPPMVAPRTHSLAGGGGSNLATCAKPTANNMAKLTEMMREHESQEAADNASNECSVCFEKAVDCVLYTCGHMCLCYECAIDIKDNQGALCPICRQAIKDIIKIYRS